MLEKFFAHFWYIVRSFTLALVLVLCFVYVSTFPKCRKEVKKNIKQDSNSNSPGKCCLWHVSVSSCMCARERERARKFGCEVMKTKMLRMY